MKNQILLLILLSVSWFSNNTFAQRNCEEYPSAIDSVYYYTWSAVDSVWILKTIQYNTINANGNIESTETYNAENREPMNMRKYFYNGADLLETVSYSWSQGEWKNTQKTIYTGETFSGIQYETIFTWQNNEWKESSRFLNYFSNSLRINYTQQLINKKTNAYYDYANYNISYTSFSKIDEWYGKKNSDGSFLWNRKYFYNDKQNLIERHLFYPVNGTLQLSIRNLYYYNQYGYNNETVNQKLNNEIWENSERYIYFRKVDFARKVSICHKGKGICVDKHAVPAFLRQGSTIGKCAISSSKGSVSIRQKAENTLNKTISVFPNPAVNSFTVVGLDENVKRIDLYNSMGQVVGTYNYFENTEFTINRNGLPVGVYFVNIVTENNISTQRVIFN